MTTVELIYDSDCPNVPEARSELLQAFARTGLTPRWSEWELNDPCSPDYARQYGSPTVLVDGKDVAGVEPLENVSCCRVYQGDTGEFRKAPTASIISSSLGNDTVKNIQAGFKNGNSGWKTSLGVAPGILFAFLPKVACPACWPAYAGILSSLGLGFLLNASYLFPLTLSFLVVAVGALAFRAKRRRGYGPFIAGLASSVVVLLGKFAFDSDPAMYLGIAILMGASLWNSWPRKKGQDPCPVCVMPEEAS